MPTLGWTGSIGSGQGATFNPIQMAATLEPGQTVLRSRIWIWSTALSPDPYTYAGVAFPFALVLSTSNVGPLWDPFTQWVTPESGIVLWSGMVPLYGSDLVAGSSPASYASESQMDPEGWNTQAQRKNGTTSNMFLWLVGQMDPSLTVGSVFTAMAVRCLISTPT